MRILRANLAVRTSRRTSVAPAGALRTFSDVDAIAGPQPDGVDALFRDEAEAILLGLKDPIFMVEGFVDERCEHRFIKRIHHSLRKGRRS